MKTLAPILLCFIALLAVTGCRPDDTDGGGTDPDSLAFVPDDTLDTGVWADDTIETYAEELNRHQLALDDVFFEYNSEELSAQMLEVLMADAGYMMTNTGFRVLLEGHCDERGTIDYNLALGERRAQSVYDYLVNYGIPASRLETVSYGKERPFVTGTDEWAYSQNRRVHLRVLPE
ncbi:MAG TPA: peptidoglycan-associated lipoprotein Pal [Candidatus Sabulitectum sp.]|nr:peptidoglycan-associated lipoprotein Pal [Candidatus Sabulitectum sp.]HPF33512.1 peptidoglycan-associated lipoprotein Pal [Candidatus Sabulitectum sp.]HPJ29295.1 peptidoglycan-associated lipoprotein Pal [Candidatus Sabulitectum sp.]HPR22277.1 peptidoglycan-associated lipoprotein Pal [Candidatus Sabulitectum sp.]